MMRNDANVRRNWLRAMYVYTFLGAGGFGLSLLLFGESGPFASQDPFFSATLGCFELALALAALLGLRDPLKFAPLLVTQLVYKMLWFAAVFVPLLLQGQAGEYTILAVVFATFIVGDLISIPFAYVFAKPSSE
jgi:hypothetical protein